jgi:hypothetical protein
MDLRNMENVLETRFPRTLEFFESALPDDDCTVVGPGDWALPSQLSYVA